MTVIQSPPEERFHALVEAGDPDSCWLWQGALRKGYGTFKVLKGQFVLPARRDLYAHRVAFYLANGRWPVPVCRHTCDTPRCCNPAHLIEGSVRENVWDMWQRGRANRVQGGSSPVAALTDAQADEIRSRYAAGGATQKVIALEFGVAQATVSRIVSGRRYQ